MRGKHNKLGEGERKVRLGQDSLPNIAISVAETSGNYIRCFSRTLKQVPVNSDRSCLFLSCVFLYVQTFCTTASKMVKLTSMVENT